MKGRKWDRKDQIIYKRKRGQKRGREWRERRKRDNRKRRYTENRKREGVS